MQYSVKKCIIFFKRVNDFKSNLVIDEKKNPIEKWDNGPLKIGKESYISKALIEGIQIVRTRNSKDKTITVIKNYLMKEDKTKIKKNKKIKVFYLILDSAIEDFYERETGKFLSTNNLFKKVD